MLPDVKGYFGPYGGKFVPETLIPALEELGSSYKRIKKDRDFVNQLNLLLKDYAGRPTPLYYAKRLSKYLGFNVFLKREDLLHTGAHKMNNTLGQGLLAVKMGKRRIIAETGAGQHGVATATVCALFGLDCVIYMGAEDMERQALNVKRMQLLGAKVVRVDVGVRTLKEATSQAIKDWVSNVKNTYYLIGSVVGPHPYPMIVRNFQAIIGKEVKHQFRRNTGKPLPDMLVACVGGGSNAMGLFYPFYSDSSVKMIGVEAKGSGFSPGKHAASLCKGRDGILHGSKSKVLQDKDGQIVNAHSIAAGLDYPGSGPEHAFYQFSGRAIYTAVSDKQALNAVKILSETEGIIPAMESAHAIAYLIKARNKMPKKTNVVVCLSGRGDKDMATFIENMEIG